MKTLYLHIGTPKTGTTSLQHFIYENQKVFEEKGFLYPSLPFRFDRIDPIRNAHFLIARCYTPDKKIDKIEEDRYFRQGMDIIMNLFKKTDNILLSDEAIWNMVFKKDKGDLWKKLKKEAEKNDFTVKIIVYLRRQDTLANSWWNQRIKRGKMIYSTTKWEDFVENPDRIALDYYEPLSMIKSFFGQENMIVRRFGKQYFKNGSIYEDYLECFGLSLSKKFVVTQNDRNLALLGNGHEIKRVLNTISDMPYKDNVFFRRILAGMSQEDIKLKSQTMFSAEEAQNFMERYREGNKKIMEEYFGENKDLFDMDFSQNDKWELDHTKMEQDIIRFVGHAVVKLREENKEMQTKVSALEKELEEQKKVMTDMQRKLENPLRKIWASFKGKK